MKWIVGGLLLAVLASVVSGRVPVAWVVYSFAALFVSMGLAIFFAFSRNKHYGLLLLGCTYVSAAIAAVVLTHWWPLVAGFVIAWLLRAMGMDPTPTELTGEPEQGATPAQSQGPASEGDKKS